MNASKVAKTVAIAAVGYVVLRVVEELVANAAPSVTPNALADMILTPRTGPAGGAA